MSTKFQFSPEEDEILIDCIRTYPVLYDIGSNEHKNRAIKEDIWGEITDKVKRTTTDCKKRWRNIRDTYMKIKRGNKWVTGSAGKPKSKWPLLQKLDFLNNVSFERSTRSNTEIVQDILTDNISPMDNSLIYSTDSNENQEMQETAIDSEDSIPLSQKRRLRAPNFRSKKRRSDTEKILKMLDKIFSNREKLVQNIHDTSLVDMDPVLMFFKTMALTVKGFEPELIAEAKCKVFNIIHDLEVRSIKQKQLGKNN